MTVIAKRHDRPGPCLHFVGFRGEEFWSAVKIWGQPHFIHIGWDRRAAQDMAPGDLVVFAKGDWTQAPARGNFPDLLPGPVFAFC